VLYRFLRGAIVAALLGLASAGAIGAPQPGPPPEPRFDRLRALEWAPFAQSFGALSDERAAAIDALLRKATILDVQEAMKPGQGEALTSEQLTLFFLSRIRQHDERLHTYVELNPAALDEAHASDTRRRAGALRGPLDGIPVSVKDNIETAAPMRTTAGAELLLGNVAAKDAPLVAQLRAQGAVILGKANLSEFAGVITFGPMNGGFSAVGGETVNPHGHYPSSGSSSGSAAGVAALLSMVSVGTETSGSLIGPSGWNGVVGMKPSRGLVNGEGVVPLVRYNDSAGPVGRSVTDVAVLLDAIDTATVNYASGLRAEALDGVTVGMLNRDIAASPENTPLLQGVSASLLALGARVRPAELALTSDWGNNATFLTYLSGGIRHDMMPYVAARARAVKTVEDLVAYNAAEPRRRIPSGQDLLAMLAPASAQMSAADYAAFAARLRRAATGILESAFRKTGAKVLVSIGTAHSPLYATAGYPAITVPLGLRVKGGVVEPPGVSSLGMPAGVTFIGKPGDDARLLAYAYAFEQATNLRVQPELR
jgi:amidase